MGILDQVRKWLGLGTTTPPETAKKSEKTIYESKTEEFEIHSWWDHIKIQDNTQAQHIISVVGFDEWVTMDEILRRIKEIFGAEYQNERSLYPYIKTLVDCGLLEISNIGGKRKWRKKDLIIRLKQLTKSETDEATQSVTISNNR